MKYLSRCVLTVVYYLYYPFRRADFRWFWSTRYLASNHCDWLPERNMATAVVDPSTLSDAAYKSVCHLDHLSALSTFEDGDGDALAHYQPHRWKV